MTTNIHSEQARHGHGHAHGVVDPSFAPSDRGVWALKWSFVGLMVTAAIQVVVVVLSGSVGLLADTIHNFADAATAIPLGVAFWLARRGTTTRRFTYGLGRVEDFAGILIILTILASALVAAYESITRLVHPQPVALLWAVMVASVVGFVGNEAVAVFRIRVGKQIGSVALIADGYHARVDGWTSLAVFVGAIGVWAGYPLADPLIGLVISAAILAIVWSQLDPSCCGCWTVWNPRRSTRSRTPRGTSPGSRRLRTYTRGGLATGCMRTLASRYRPACRWRSAMTLRAMSATNYSTTCRTSAA